MTVPIFDWAAAAEAGSAQADGKGWQLGRLAQLGVSYREASSSGLPPVPAASQG